ncbi:MAG: TonB-dependent receptor [Pseudomonadota bacterium]
MLGSTALASVQFAVAQDQQAAQPAAEEEEDAAVLGEVVVRGQFIPDEKRATSEISSVLDEASFARTGDGDIGSALSRVAGISVSDGGKFVIVRGLNDRYSSVTINGSPLPSPEPLRRVVPLDLIPTSFLGGALVQKTFSPQFSGEFGGGLVELRTKSVPDEFYLNIGASIGVDTVTTGQDGLLHDGGDTDYLGFDDGTRNLPDPVLTAFFGTDGIGAFDQEELDLSLGVPETLITFIDDRPPNHGFSLEFGGFYDISPDIKLGANFAANFSNDWQTRQGRRERGLVNTALNADAQPFDEDLPSTIAAELQDFTSTQQTTLLNGLAAFGVEVGSNHEVTSTTLVLRSTTNDTRLEDFVVPEEDSVELLRENFEFIENQVWQTQLSGEHVFPALFDLSVAWRGAYGEAFRDAPFQRTQLRGRTSPDEPFALTFAPSFSVGSIGVNASTVSFSRIDDQNIDAGIDFELPFRVLDNAVDFKFGYAYTDKERESLVRDFIFQATGFPDSLAFIRNDVLFSEDVAGTDVFDATLITNPISLDNAFSSLEVQAGYVGLDAEVGPYFRLAVGARWEGSDQLTQAFSTSLPDATFSESLIDGDFLLPTVTLTWNPVGNLQLRLGYSETITRPQFRELTPATFLDDQTDQLIIGNPFLQNSEIQNFDARLEYYLGRGQFITLGGFYKDIENPIETTSDLLGGQVLQTFVNAPSAEVFGAEFEYEQTFDVGNWTTNRFLNSTELVFKTNYTYSDSSVDANGTVVSAAISSATGAEAVIQDGTDFIVDGRRLQGQSEHLVNVQIGLEEPETNGKATLLLNWASERIRQTENVFTGGITPAVIEETPVLLDFVVSRDFVSFGQTWNLELAARNLIGDDYEATQTFDDGTVADFDVFDLGREFTAKATVKF